MSNIEKNKNLKTLNTFNVKARADAFLQLDSPAEIEKNKDVFSNYTKRFILGGGSNLLFKGDYNGLIIYPQFFGIKPIDETTDYIKLRVSASENWHQFVGYCLKHDYFGLENLALIPGTVGASPVQNIGAYGVEVEQFIESVECYDLNENKFILFSHEECQFAYRESRLKSAGQGRYIVCHVNFRLNKYPSLVLNYAPIKKRADKNESLNNITTAKNVYDWVCQLRREKLPDPNELANAGSFFKNPMVSEEQLTSLKKDFPNLVAYPSEKKYKVAAGWLIDHAGLKGYTLDKVGIHKDQALVIVNHSEEDGAKIWQLACYVIEKIKSIYQIDLEPEVRVLGD